MADKKGYETTEITVVLTTGSVISAEVASIEEVDIMQSLCDALRLRGAVVSDLSVIRCKDVTDTYQNKFKGEGLLNGGN